MQPRGLDGRLPVFVFPSALTFYTDDQTSHKQILTLYNPYEFRISYSVLCNNPTCFTVDPPEGVVRAKCSVDMIITRTSLNPAAASERDRIRVVIFEDGSRSAIGKKDVSATLVIGVPEVRPSGGGGSDSDQFQSVHAPPTQLAVPPLRTQPFSQYNGKSPSLLLVIIAMLCLGALWLPTKGETSESTLHPYLHLNVNVKIVISYALGLMTYAIMRPL